MCSPSSAQDSFSQNSWQPGLSLATKDSNSQHSLLMSAPVFYFAAKVLKDNQFHSPFVCNTSNTLFTCFDFSLHARFDIVCFFDLRFLSFASHLPVCCFLKFACFFTLILIIACSLIQTCPAHMPPL